MKSEVLFNVNYTQQVSEEFPEQQKQHVQRPGGTRDQATWYKKRLEVSRPEHVGFAVHNEVLKGMEEGSIVRLVF